MVSLFWFNLGSSIPRDPCVLCVEASFLFVVSSLHMDQLGDHLELHLHRVSQRLFPLSFMNVLKKKNERWKTKSNSWPHVLGRMWSSFWVSNLQGQSVPSFLDMKNLIQCFRTVKWETKWESAACICMSSFRVVLDRDLKFISNDWFYTISQWWVKAVL